MQTKALALRSSLDSDIHLFSDPNSTGARRAARSTSTVSRRRLWMRDRTMLALTLATKLSARLSLEDCCLAALTFARGCVHMPPLATPRVVTASSLMAAAAAATMEMIMVEEGHCRSTSTTLRVQAQSSSRGPTESTCNAATTTSAEAVRNINALFGAFYAENHFHQGRLGTNMGKVEKRGVFRRGAFKLRREMSARPPFAYLPSCCSAGQAPEGRTGRSLT